MLFIDCSKMARLRINTRNHTKEKPHLIIRIFFEIGKSEKEEEEEKKSIGWPKYMYVSEICAGGIFVTFPW